MEEREHPVQIRNIDNIQDSGNFVFFDLLRLNYRYPIELNSNAETTDGKPLSNCVAVKVDTQQTAKKVFEIFDSLNEYSRWRIIEMVDAVAPSGSSMLFKLLNGDETGFYSMFPNHPVRVIEPIDPNREFTQRCFLRAFENCASVTSPSGMSLADLFGAGENERALYDSLIQTDLRPVDPEAMALMLMPVVDDILRGRPSLRPEAIYTPKRKLDQLRLPI